MLGALFALVLQGGRAAVLSRGNTAMERAAQAHGPEKLQHLDLAIEAFGLVRAARAIDSEGSAHLASALLEKIGVCPRSDRAALRARAIAALNPALREVEGSGGDIGFALATLLSAVWALEPDEDRTSPEALPRLVRARDAQARAVALCPQGHPLHLQARIQLLACALHVVEHPLCPVPAGEFQALSGLLADLARKVSDLPTLPDGAPAQEVYQFRMQQGRYNHLASTLIDR